jgi:hypothetical protein
MGKEDVANAIFTADGRFFSFMDTNGGNIEPGTALTIAKFLGEPVGMTFAGTKGAVI